MISSCGLEGGIFGSATVRLRGLAPGAYTVFVDFIEGRVFVERVAAEIDLAASGRQQVVGVFAGSHRLPVVPKCEVDSVFTLPKEPNAPRVEIWKSAVYASQSPRYP